MSGRTGCFTLSAKMNFEEFAIYARFDKAGFCQNGGATRWRCGFYEKLESSHVVRYFLADIHAADGSSEPGLRPSFFSSSRTRRTSAGNCWMAMIWRLIDAVGEGGGAEDFFAIGNVAHDAGLCHGDGVVADLQMAGDADLAAENDVIAELRAAGDAHLRNEQAVIADGDVVGDLDEVVDFRSLADGRRRRARRGQW